MPKSEILDQVRSRLVEIAGDQVVSEGTEELVDTVPRQPLDLHPQVHFPPQTPFGMRRRVSEEVLQQAALDTWPTVPLAALDGKTPEQVAGDPAYRVQLAAALLALEQYADVHDWLIQVDALRQKLGVPVPAPVDPPAGDDQLVHLTPSDWARVVTEKLADSTLKRLFERAVAYHCKRAIWRLGNEIMARPSLAEQVNRSAVCMILAELAANLDQSLDFVLKAKQFATETGKSPAKCLLAELPLRLLRGDGAEAQQVIDTLRTRHKQEPGVMESLYKLLVRFGILSPDGRPAAAPPAEMESAAPAASQLWTPDAPQAAAEGQKTSKLWVPD